ncbi:hypothetical protein SK128_013738 [Halocaridina rubra]|uniref:Uncharacterized protein n=1 Tax=Halocaridina rubra TaxID=373956 RepID=A0AAN9A4F0_HALRR
MARLGGNALEWIKSYLEGKKQTVRVRRCLNGQCEKYVAWVCGYYRKEEGQAYINHTFTPEATWGLTEGYSNMEGRGATIQAPHLCSMVGN